ncbi:MAG: FHA domain-containing protein [Ramlibacter sp.]
MTRAPLAPSGLFALLKRFVFGYDTAMQPDGFEDGPRLNRSQSPVAQPSSDYLFTALDEAATNFLCRFSFSEMQRLQFRLKQVDVHVPAHLASLASWLLQTPSEARREAAANKLRALDPEFRLDLTGFTAWNVCIGQPPATSQAGAIVEELHVYTRTGVGQPGIQFAFVGELHNHASLTRDLLKQQHERNERKAAAQGRTQGAGGHSLTYRCTGTGEMRTLAQFPVLVGSGDEADLHLAAQAVSRVHAAFEIGPNGQLGVRDTSTNGTWLNGSRLRHNEFHPLGARGQIRFCAPAGDARSIELQYTVSSGGREATELIGPAARAPDTTPVIGQTPTARASGTGPRAPTQPAGDLVVEKWIGDGHMVREVAARLPYVLSHAETRVRLSSAGQEGYVLGELQAGEATIDGSAVPRFFVLGTDGRKSLRLGKACAVALHPLAKGAAA